SGRALKGFHRRVAGGADAERGVGDLAGPGFRRRDQRGERTPRLLRADYDRLWRETEVGDRLEIAHRVVGQLRIDCRVDAERSTGTHDQRIAVWRGVLRRFGAGNAAGAG